MLKTYHEWEDNIKVNLK